MSKKNVYLIATILGFLVFIGFMTETGPKSFFGFELNIWFFRLVWTAFTVSFFLKYRELRKS